jgi:toxin ParE1/3/4
VIFTDKAQADLEEIWEYSARRWGQEQADRYLKAIADAAEDVAAGRLRSRAIDFVRPGLRKTRCVRHFIYFRERDNGIRVVRVLHDQMDETLHLL